MDIATPLVVSLFDHKEDPSVYIRIFEGIVFCLIVIQVHFHVCGSGNAPCQQRDCPPTKGTDTLGSNMGPMTDKVPCGVINIQKSESLSDATMC